MLFISFLHRLRLIDRRFFVFTMLCMFVQLFFTFLKFEATPFFLFGMYSERMTVTDTVSSITLEVNGCPLRELHSPLRERFLLETTVINYETMRAHSGVDPVRRRIESHLPSIVRCEWYTDLSAHIYNQPADLAGYRLWLKQKCLAIAGIRSGKVQVVRTTGVLSRATGQVNHVTHEVLDEL